MKGRDEYFFNPIDKLLHVLIFSIIEWSQFKESLLKSFILKAFFRLLFEFKFGKRFRVVLVEIDQLREVLDNGFQKIFRMLLLFKKYVFEVGVDPWSFLKIVFSFFHVFLQSLHIHWLSLNEGHTVNLHLLIGVLLLRFIKFWLFLFLFPWGVVDAFGWFVFLLGVLYFFNFGFFLHFLKIRYNKL